MNPLAVLCLLGATVVGEGVLAQVGAPGERTDGQVEQSINRVRTLAASKLDRKLPKLSLEDWLRTEAGPGSRVSWALDVYGDRKPDCVEINVALQDGRYIYLRIAVGADNFRPYVDHAAVLAGREDTELRRLHDLAKTLHTTRQNSQSF
jgi:hypothetical protein